MVIASSMVKRRSVLNLKVLLLYKELVIKQFKMWYLPSGLELHMRQFIQMTAFASKDKKYSISYNDM